jgi:hypothetical protein
MADCLALDFGASQYVRQKTIVPGNVKRLKICGWERVSNQQVDVQSKFTFYTQTIQISEGHRQIGNMSANRINKQLNAAKNVLALFVHRSQLSKLNMSRCFKDGRFEYYVHLFIFEMSAQMAEFQSMQVTENAAHIHCQNHQSQMRSTHLKTVRNSIKTYFTNKHCAKARRAFQCANNESKVERSAPSLLINVKTTVVVEAPFLSVLITPN